MKFTQQEKIFDEHNNSNNNFEFKFNPREDSNVYIEINENITKQKISNMILKTHEILNQFYSEKNKTEKYNISYIFDAYGDDISCVDDFIDHIKEIKTNHENVTLKGILAYGENVAALMYMCLPDRTYVGEKIQQGVDIDNDGKQFIAQQKYIIGSLSFFPVNDDNIKNKIKEVLVSNNIDEQTIDLCFPTIEEYEKNIYYCGDILIENKMSKLES
jgi:hypothetical protein